MVNIRKKEPRPHVVIVDTNVLWCREKSYAVDPNFDSFWELYCREFKLELLVPEIVQSELLFQQCMSAEKLMTKASVALEEASQVVEGKYSHRMTKATIKKKVEKKLSKWLKSNGGQTVDLPVEQIDWRAIVEASLWRKPPFEFDTKKKELEKGFRDALILETLVHEFGRSANDKKKLVFICADGLLRDTADGRMKNISRYDSYESLEDFESFLKLTREEFENDFIRSILRRASTKFFKNNNELCLYYRENIRSKLKNEFKTFFENPEESLGEGKSLRSALIRANNVVEDWVAKKSGSFWIGNSRFEKVEESNNYSWVNPVHFIQLFRPPDIEVYSTERNSGELADYLLMLEFEVHWSAKVTRDGRFKNIEIVETVLKNNSFQPPTDGQVTRWNLYPSKEK